MDCRLTDFFGKDLSQSFYLADYLHDVEIRKFLEKNINFENNKVIFVIKMV